MKKKNDIIDLHDKLDSINSEMRSTFLLLLIIFVACNNSQQKNTRESTDTIKILPDTLMATEEAQADTLLLKTYANKRFRDVAIERVGQYTFLVSGQGQIFEANFSWVVEDGHEELKKGFQMTDAGAPEWGNFKFAINVQKKRENSTLTLILFESSPKNGSRQYELPITLY